MKYIQLVFCCLIPYGCLATLSSIYEGNCQYVNDVKTRSTITGLMETYLEDAIFVPEIGRNPDGHQFANGYYQRSSMRRYQGIRWTAINHLYVHEVLQELLATFADSLKLTDKCIPYGCKAIKCSLPDAEAIDVIVSCAIGNSSAMLSRHLKSDFEDYFKKLHQDLSWDYGMSENALNEEFVRTKIEGGHLWSRITKPIYRVNYGDIQELVKAVIPTIFTENEKETIKKYKYDAEYGCEVHVHRKDLLMDVACLIHDGTHQRAPGR